MSYVVGTDSRQMMMGVWSVEDEVPQDSPTQFIEVFVESLDAEKLGFRHAVPAETGRPAYHPGDLLKLYLYGYLNKIHSSRRLMRECAWNIELWFMLNRLQPDFRTIADFRKQHRKLLRKIFVLFVRSCREMSSWSAKRYVPVIMYGNPRFSLRQIPDIAQNSPHNNFGKLKRAEKRVMVFIRRDIRKQKLRQQTSEHPFGTIKHYDDGRHFLCRDKEKVAAEFALSALSYNIRRAITLCGGVQKLIERYRSIAMPKIRKIAEI